MSGYLNTSTSFILYKQLFNSEYFVDKSGIISMINKRIQTNVIKLNVKMRRKQVEKIKHNEIWVD